jgi:hypothetical protein
MFTGEPLFAAKYPIALQQMHLFTAPRRPDAVDPAVERAILRALAKAPEQRQPDVQTFLTELSSARV